MRPRKFVRSTALVLVLTAALTVTAFAADPTQRPANETDNKSSYYPTSVEMTEDDAGNPMIRKTYQLSVSDDPQKLPVADFERDGRRYYLLDMTKEDKIGVDTKEHSETVKLSSDTKEMEQILQRLDAQKEVTTEDGHTGVLTLDHTSVKVTADGYGTKKRTLSATRTYPNLSDADVALIPKTIQDNTLAASATALKLASNERVTEIMFVFGQAPAGFAQVEKPYLHCKAVTGLSAGSFVNVADVGGTYGGTWVQGISRWVTTVYGKPVIPTLPKTGY